MSTEHARMRFVLIVALMVGCSTKPNPKSCLDNHCSDPGLPFCDVDGAIGGEPNTCIAVECTPGEFEACRGDRALTCNTVGDNFDLVDCEFGCGDTGCKLCDTPTCEKRIVPKYLPTTCDALATIPALTITSNTMLNTSNDLECSSVVTQPTGPEICVLRYGTITVDRNFTYSVTGTRALALVADRALTVDGILDVSGSSNVSGPGGSFTVSGLVVGAAGAGAGNRTVGGNAGSASADGGGAIGGAAAPHPATRTELFGGARSNNVLNNGGGAVTLISCRGMVSVPGLIDAGGGGGQRGFLQAMNYQHPTGGGSGGTIVLQGMMVNVTGQIYANGGGGGSGGDGSTNTNGLKGTRSTSPAAGGSGAAEGGAGGAMIPPGDGRLGTSPGAGGGSAGFILTYTPQLVFPMLTSVAVSPAFEPNGNVATN